MPGRARLWVAVAAAVVLTIGALLLSGRSATPARRGASAAPDPAQPAPARATAPSQRSPAPPPSFPAAPPAAQAPAAPLVEGRVVSRATGRGVPGAEVTFSRGGAAAVARAEADGAFRFEAPVEGRWLVAAVTAPGFLPFAPEWGHSPVVVDARAGASVRGIELRLAPATQIVGTVSGPDGERIAGAEVRVLPARGEASLVGIADRFTTDAAGEFRFAAPRGAVVEARKDGFAPGRAEVDAGALVERRLAVRLHARGDAVALQRIAGRVVEKGAGAPVAGALVAAERLSRSGWLSPAGQVVTGLDGRFALADLAPGAYRLVASAEGRARAVARVEAGGGEATLELARGGVLRGCVRSAASGAPVTAFTVTVVERRDDARAPALVRSFLDPAGCFTLDDVAAGPVALAAFAPGFAPSSDVAVDVPVSGEASADLRLAAARRLRGVIVDAERRTPVSGARIALEGGSPGAGAVVGLDDEAWSDAEGRFELAAPPRRFSLEVTAPGHHTRVAGGLEVPDGAELAPLVVAVTPTAPGEETRREITGIGVAIASGDGALLVTAVMAGGGAASAGIVKGDAIVRVDGVPIAELGLAGAVNAIRGPEGTSVRLGVRRGDGTLDVWVGRGVVRG